MFVVLGVDPGLNGAIAYCTSDRLQDVIFLDIPTLRVSARSRGKGKSVNKVDVPTLVRELEFLDSFEDKIAFVEQVHAMPKQGVSSSFSFGFVSGIITGVLTAKGCAIHYVAPNIWKKHYKLSSDKNSSVLLSRQLYPRLDISSSDRAEALLILKYGLSILPGLYPQLLENSIC